jgi:hypothetical protein
MQAEHPPISGQTITCMSRRALVGVVEILPSGYCPNAGVAYQPIEGRPDVATVRVHAPEVCSGGVRATTMEPDTTQAENMRVSLRVPPPPPLLKGLPSTTSMWPKVWLASRPKFCRSCRTPSYSCEPSTNCKGTSQQQQQGIREWDSRTAVTVEPEDSEDGSPRRGPQA